MRDNHLSKYKSEERMKFLFKLKDDLLEKHHIFHTANLDTEELKNEYTNFYNQIEKCISAEAKCLIVEK